MDCTLLTQKQRCFNNFISLMKNALFQQASFAVVTGWFCSKAGQTCIKCVLPQNCFYDLIFANFTRCLQSFCTHCKDQDVDRISRVISPTTPLHHAAFWQDLVCCPFIDSSVYVWPQNFYLLFLVSCLKKKEHIFIIKIWCSQLFFVFLYKSKYMIKYN